jgi:hypothetical protein
MSRKKYREYRDEEQMIGPFWFEPRTVAAIGAGPRGVYLLTHESRGPVPRILVVYVGRGGLRDRLASHLVDDSKDALHFFFKLVDDEAEAFEEECRLFHTYGRARHLDNKIHPAVPAIAPGSYPRCAARWLA